MDSLTQPRMEISDLPIEILEIILDYLTVADLKNASLVCRQWSHLAFSGRRMDHIRFVVQIQNQENKPLREGQRQYRHIGLGCGSADENIHIKFIQAIKGFKKNVTSLGVRGEVELSQIQHILLEVPNLKALSFVGLALIRRYEFDGILMLPVFHQLSMTKNP
ncbi:uncharacterized protein LOC131266195 [Anopheles coustani]|uniref:uncharacterized protein LOC131266195 n=1 Tax=Anopheles coustani TaxID=139045 RepID=UPI00265B2A77|nr:uncharacterized protein LOC131266195 [Anopheles coustani]